MARWTLGGYLTVAVVGRLIEAAGLRRCGCAPSCWCKRRVLSTFRWAFPYGHRSFDPADKERLAACSPSDDRPDAPPPLGELR